MRPPPAVLQCLQPQCLLSRFSPHTIHNRRIFLVRLLVQIDVDSMVCSSQVKVIFDHCSTRYSLLQGIPNRPSYGVFPSDKKIFFFSDSSNIPWNPPTIRCPDLTAKARQMSLLSICAVLRRLLIWITGSGTPPLQSTEAEQWQESSHRRDTETSLVSHAFFLVVALFTLRAVGPSSYPAPHCMPPRHTWCTARSWGQVKLRKIRRFCVTIRSCLPSTGEDVEQSCKRERKQSSMPRSPELRCT